MSERMTRQLALDALSMAVRARTPPVGLLHHSDRGSQYASGDYRAALVAAEHAVQHERQGQLLGQRRGRRLLLHTLKAELVHKGRLGNQRLSTGSGNVSLPFHILMSTTFTLPATISGIFLACTFCRAVADSDEQTVPGAQISPRPR